MKNEWIPMMTAMAYVGGYVAIALTSLGCSIGSGIAGCAAVGSWKRSYLANKPASFLLTVLAGATLSQMIYALVFMVMINKHIAANTMHPMPLFHFLLGLFIGVGFMLSAVFQGKAAAAGIDAYGETNKGFANYLIVVGIVETIPLFLLVFAIMALGAVNPAEINEAMKAAQTAATQAAK